MHNRLQPFATGISWSKAAENVAAKKPLAEEPHANGD